MPLYTCIADDRTSDDQRQRIALAITDAHCSHTGAPAEFVHVFFNDFLGGDRKSDLRVVGSIRAGRPPALKDRLHADIIARIAQILSCAPTRVRLALQEVRPEWNMEGGAVLPQPGSEADWMKTHWADREDEDASPEQPADTV